MCSVLSLAYNAPVPLPGAQADAEIPVAFDFVGQNTRVGEHPLYGVIVSIWLCVLLCLVARSFAEDYIRQPVRALVRRAASAFDFVFPRGFSSGSVNSRHAVFNLGDFELDQSTRSILVSNLDQAALPTSSSTGPAPDLSGPSDDGKDGASVDSANQDSVGDITSLLSSVSIGTDDTRDTHAGSDDTPSDPDFSPEAASEPPVEETDAGLEEDETHGSAEDSFLESEPEASRQPRKNSEADNFSDLRIPGAFPSDLPEASSSPSPVTDVASEAASTPSPTSSNLDEDVFASESHAEDSSITPPSFTDGSCSPPSQSQIAPAVNTSPVAEPRSQTTQSSGILEQTRILRGRNDARLGASRLARGPVHHQVPASREATQDHRQSHQQTKHVTFGAVGVIVLPQEGPEEERDRDVAGEEDQSIQSGHQVAATEGQDPDRLGPRYNKQFSPRQNAILYGTGADLVEQAPENMALPSSHEGHIEQPFEIDPSPPSFDPPCPLPVPDQQPTWDTTPEAMEDIWQCDSAVEECRLGLEKLTISDPDYDALLASFLASLTTASPMDLDQPEDEPETPSMDVDSDDSGYMSMDVDDEDEQPTYSHDVLGYPEHQTGPSFAEPLPPAPLPDEDHVHSIVIDSDVPDAPIPTVAKGKWKAVDDDLSSPWVWPAIDPLELFNDRLTQRLEGCVESSEMRARFLDLSNDIKTCIMDDERQGALDFLEEARQRVHCQPNEASLKDAVLSQQLGQSEANLEAIENALLSQYLAQAESRAKEARAQTHAAWYYAWLVTWENDGMPVELLTPAHPKRPAEYPLEVSDCRAVSLRPVKRRKVEDGEGYKVREASGSGVQAHTSSTPGNSAAGQGVEDAIDQDAKKEDDDDDDDGSESEDHDGHDDDDEDDDSDDSDPSAGGSLGNSTTNPESAVDREPPADRPSGRSDDADNAVDDADLEASQDALNRLALEAIENDPELKTRHDVQQQRRRVSPPVGTSPRHPEPSLPPVQDSDSDEVDMKFVAAIDELAGQDAEEHPSTAPDLPTANEDVVWSEADFEKCLQSAQDEQDLSNLFKKSKIEGTNTPDTDRDTSEELRQSIEMAQQGRVRLAIDLAKAEMSLGNSGRLTSILLGQLNDFKRLTGNGVGYTIQQAAEAERMQQASSSLLQGVKRKAD